MSKNKTHSMHIRFSEDEFATLKKAAAASNMSIAAYVRSTSVKGQTTPQIKTIEISPAEEFKRSLAAISSVGGNINQIARALNRNGEFKESALLEGLAIVLGEITELKRMIVELRGKIV